MTSDRRRTIESLCLEALAVDARDRPAFLDDACRGNADLRREVDSLLAAEREESGFLAVPPLDMVNALAPGLMLGPYEVIEYLGCGGMGEVYKARDTRLGRVVAIKLLPPALSHHDERRRRFRREARAIAALAHPHICGLHDLGEHDGCLFLVLEFVEGETLATVLRNGPLPIDLVRQYAIEIAGALDDAHSHGVVHRDLKPGNIMVTGQGVKLLDFGLATFRPPALSLSDSVADDPAVSTLTSEGSVIGTLPYMSPEQVEGRPTDARTDLFTFGAIVYEMATGRRAFDADSYAGLVGAICQRNPPAMLSLRPDAPVAIDRVVTRCLAKDPAERFQTADDVRTALQDRQASEVGYPRNEARGRLWRGRARRQAAAIAVVLVAASAGYLYLTRPTDQPLSVLTVLTNQPSIVSFPSVSPDGREFVYASGPLDYFGESDIYRQDVGTDRASNNLTPDSPGSDTQPAFSPDGNLIAFRSDRSGGGLFLMARDGTAVRPLTPDGYNPAWSPDGTQIAYATVHTMASPFANVAATSALRVVDVRSGTRRTIRERAAAQPSWSKQGHRIAYWALGVISTCAPDGSDERIAVPGGGYGIHNWNPVWSPDGRFLYFSSNRTGVMHLWRIRMNERTGRAIGVPEPAPVPMPSTFVAHPSFDAAGRLLFASLPIRAAIERIAFDFQSGRVRGERETLTPRSQVRVWPEASPDGARLAFHQLLDDANVGSIHTSDADGRNIQRLTHERGDRLPRWSWDGRAIAFYSVRGGQSNIWVIDADGRNLRQVTHATTVPVLFPVWSPRGLIAASEQQPGSRSFIFDPVRGWDDGASTVVLPAPEPSNQFIPWSWSPDGTRLAGFGRPRAGILVWFAREGRYRRLTTAGSTPVWLPDGERLLYSVTDRLLILDTRTGESHVILDVAPNRLEMAAGGGFSIAASTGYVYFAAAGREAAIWHAAPEASR